MADIIRWCCWRFDPEAQRTVPPRNQRTSTDDQVQLLREEVQQLQERTAHCVWPLSVLLQNTSHYRPQFLSFLFEATFGVFGVFPK